MIPSDGRILRFGAPSPSPRGLAIKLLRTILAPASDEVRGMESLVTPQAAGERCAIGYVPQVGSVGGVVMVYSSQSLRRVNASRNREGADVSDTAEAVPRRGASEASGWKDVAAPGGWYASLRKPAWNPPAWLFGPVWTALYVSMAVAAWLVWREGGWTANRLPLGWFALQLALNAIWSPLFFRFHRPGWALVDCVLLVLSVAATLVAFWRVSVPAGALLVPYLAWVCFAAFLNFTIWRLNR